MKLQTIKNKRKTNECLKERNIENPYEVWKTQDGSWEWRVLKKWQIDDDGQYSRWMCGVKSPFTYGQFEIGDVYVKDIKENAIKVDNEKEKMIILVDKMIDEEIN